MRWEDYEVEDEKSLLPTFGSANGWEVRLSVLVVGIVQYCIVYLMLSFLVFGRQFASVHVNWRYECELHRCCISLSWCAVVNVFFENLLQISSYRHHFLAGLPLRFFICKMTFCYRNHCQGPQKGSTQCADIVRTCSTGKLAQWSHIGATSTYIAGKLTMCKI